MIEHAGSYPSYKDSGVPWLGEAPDHWDVKRNKLILEEVDERSKGGLEELLSVSQYTGITPRRVRQATQGGLLTNAASLVGHKRVMPNDLVINIMLAWNGSLGVSPLEGIVSTAYCVFRAKAGVEPRFLHYLFRTPLFTGVFKTVSTGVVDSRLRLYPDVFLRLPTPLPPLEEQAAIVRFLDLADRRVRRYIAAKQKLIALLNEQKQAIIERAVTRGLDSDVRFKPSGVEGLGEVPEHWEVAQLRRLIQRGTSVTYGIVQAGPDVEGGVPYIRTSDMKADGLAKSGYLRTSPEIDRAYARSKVATDDLVVAIRASLGRGLLVPPFLNGANLTQGTARVSPGERLRPTFLSYAFNSRYCQESIQMVAKGTTFLEITLDALRRVTVAVPPLREQDRILESLRGSVADLEAGERAATTEMSLLREYRTRLISDVVTGKLDVREAEAQLSDRAEEAEPLDATDDLAEVDESDGNLDTALEVGEA